MNAFRLPGLAIVIALIVGAVVLDQQRSAPEIATQEIRLPAASVRGGDALSSTWFCAAATSAQGLADSEVLLSNTQPTERTATISVFEGSSLPANDAAVDEMTIPIPALTTTSLRLADLRDADIVSIAVEVDGGGVLVDKISTGATGVARTACADDGSTEWALTSGSTTPGSRLQLVVFNPFPDFATVDIEFVSSLGARSPEGLIGLPIPARSSRVIEIGDFFASSENITSFVRVRSGRVVAETIQSFDGTGSPEGLSVFTGAPAPADIWTFPGVTPGAGPARVVIVNPSERRISANVDIFPAARERFVEPFEVVLQPGQGEIIDLNAPRLDGIASFTAVVRSLDGPLIIAGFEQRPAVVEPDPVAEAVELEVDAPTTGFAAATGQPILSTSLFTTVDVAEGDERSAIHVFNPAEDTFVRVTATVIVDGASREVPIEVGPQRTTRIALADIATGRYALRLDASGPIVATREITGLSSRSWAPMLPGAEGVPAEPTVSRPSTADEADDTDQADADQADADQADDDS